MLVFESQHRGSTDEHDDKQGVAHFKDGSCHGHVSAGENFDHSEN
jgi:hypothetical protein